MMSVDKSKTQMLQFISLLSDLAHKTGIQLSAVQQYIIDYLVSSSFRAEGSVGKNLTLSLSVYGGPTTIGDETLLITHQASNT